MITIWKYSLKLDDKIELEIPEGARILSVQMQGSVPSLWALVDSEAKKEIRVFYIFGTGTSNPLLRFALDYIGTFQERFFVWHVFEEVY